MAANLRVISADQAMMNNPDRVRVVKSLIGQEGTLMKLVVSIEDRVTSILARQILTRITPKEVDKEAFENDDEGVIIEDFSTPTSVRYQHSYAASYLITNHGHLLYRTVTGEHVWAENEIVGNSPTQLVMISGSDLELISKQVLIKAVNRVVLKPDNGQFQLMAFLVPLVRIPGFLNALEEYKNFPDKDIEFIPPHIVTPEHPERPEGDELRGAVGKEFMKIRTVFQVEKPEGRAIHTVLSKEADLVALTFTFIYAMTKSGDERNVIKALTARLSALRNSLKLEELVVEDFIAQFIGKNDIKAINDTLSFYPNLKAMIFSSILAFDTPFNNYIRLILKESQLTVFNLIVKFCTESDLTALHINPKVMKDYPGFSRAYSKLQRRYGRAWPFCKLIHPTEELATLNKFPNLAMAAKAHAFTVLNMTTLRNLKGMEAIPPSYFSHCKIPLAAGMEGPELQKASYVKKCLGYIRTPESLASINDELLVEIRNSILGQNVPQSVRSLLDDATE